MIKIMVVDDQPICREPIAEALRARGYDVRCAGNGQAAIQLLEDQPPDLMLLDVAMPQMDGLEVLQSVRQNPDWRGIPVILLTDHADRDRVRRGAELGIQGYILKSAFSLDALLARIREQLDQPKPASPAAEPAVEPRAAGPTAASPVTPPPVVTAHETAPAKIQAPPPTLPRLTREQLQKRLNDSPQLKTLAGVVAEVLSLAGSSSADRSELAAALNRDPVLAASVLRVANSSAYRVCKPRVYEVEHAIANIGFAGVRNIVSTVGVMDAFPPDASDGFSSMRCWQHCLAVATILDRVGSDSQTETARHLVGLFHDLPEIVLRQYFADECRLIEQAAAATGAPRPSLETKVFGLPPADLRTLILSKLGLPQELLGPVSTFLKSPVPQRGTPPLLRALAHAHNYAHGLLFANGSDAAICSFTAVEADELGVQESAALEPNQLRAEIITATSLLANLPRADEVRLAQPIIRPAPVRVWYARHPGFVAIDPVANAMMLLAQTQIHDRPPVSAADLANTDAVVLVAPQADSDQFSVREAAHVRADGTTVPVLHLVGRLPSRAGAALPAGVSAMTYPVALSDLASFLADCKTGEHGG